MIQNTHLVFLFLSPAKVIFILVCLWGMLKLERYLIVQTLRDRDESRDVIRRYMEMKRP